MESKLEFSAKITHSVCLSLESMGIVHGDFLEEVGLTPEKAFDPEAWIDAETLEKFLSYISYKIPTLSLKSIALEEFNLNGWGVLNQVLKILKTSLEIYSSPQSYLSYFVRPLSAFTWIEKTNENTVFQTELSSEEFPLVTDYLSGALEVVSAFVESEEDSSVFWTGNTVTIEWGEKNEIQNSSQISSSLSSSDSAPDLNSTQEQLIQSVKHLEDYFLRSRQLISLIKAESGKKRWFNKALQRLDWDNLESHHQNTVEDLISMIKQGSDNFEGDEKTSLDDEEFQLKMQ